MYLGKDVDPREYYRRYAAQYENPHADGVEAVLRQLQHHLEPRVLDLGCGKGLVTKLLGDMDVVGIDESLFMVNLYVAETRRYARTGYFWEELPTARSAVASYSLHLCPESRVHDFVWRLREAGVKKLVVISPLKRAIRGLGLVELEACTSTSKVADEKTVWGWVFAV